MVKIIIEREELTKMLKQRFGAKDIKWNQTGNAMLEVDMSDMLYTNEEDKK